MIEASREQATDGFSRYFFRWSIWISVKFMVRDHVLNVRADSVHLQRNLGIESGRYRSRHEGKRGRSSMNARSHS
jgi:hypothetical protein